MCFSYQAPGKENYDIGVAEATMIKPCPIIIIVSIFRVVLMNCGVNTPPTPAASNCLASL